MNFKISDGYNESRGRVEEGSAGAATRGTSSRNVLEEGLWTETGQSKQYFTDIVVVEPTFSPSANYYKEYWKVYLQNEELLGVLQEYQSESLDLQRKINAIQVPVGLIVNRDIITPTQTKCLVDAESTFEGVPLKLPKSFFALTKNVDAATAPKARLISTLRSNTTGETRLTECKLLYSTVVIDHRAL